MKGFKKGLWLMALCSAVVIGTAGCSSSTSEQGTQSSPSAAPSVTETASAAPTAIFPLKEKASFEIFNSAHDTKPQSGNEPIFAEIEKRTNVQLKLINIPNASYEDKYKVTLVSGELPDVMESNLALAKRYGMDGAFMALDDLLNEFGPNILQAIKDEGVEASLRASDGKIYGIPFFTMPGVTASVPQFRQDWLDQVQLKAPSTPDEFYQVLKAFKDAKLGGEETIPFAPQGYNNFPIFRAFGADHRMYLNSEGVFQFGPSLPGMKDALTFLNKLFTEKLIDPEFAIISKQQWEAKVSNGTVGSIYFNPSRTDFFTDILKKENPQAKMVGSGAIKNKNGIGELLPDYSLKGVMAISSKSKNAELIVKFYNYLYSPEGKLLTQYGIEGTSYTMKDGKPQYTEEFKKDMINNPVKLGISTSKYFFSPPMPSLFQDRNQGMLVADAVETSKPDWTKQEPQLSFTQEEQDIVSKSMQPIMDTTSEYMINFIMGQEPISNFDKFVGELNKRGLEDLVKTYNAAYQRALKASQ
ncbi:ABC transporter substrate-binding protein [Paenibacillus agaridevorans]|uniref:ABC transporter substrate-binding protein n=1 Tax=Paenibacillus agaridevorans TaxID=171404 RepID=A0A2R5EGE8_9BACL|nr:extracellular solute-binding protein [Paenibacillus agaridevorans]GBG05587.1 ABC transporter substrate-binding protein [Paenibacillus agaridevorans]